MTILATTFLALIAAVITGIAVSPDHRFDGTPAAVVILGVFAVGIAMSVWTLS